MGRFPSGQRGLTVNQLANAFGGSNPPLPITHAEVAQSVEQHLDMVEVVGSSPIPRTENEPLNRCKTVKRLVVFQGFAPSPYPKRPHTPQPDYWHFSGIFPALHLAFCRRHAILEREADFSAPLSTRARHGYTNLTAMPALPSSASVGGAFLRGAAGKGQNRRGLTAPSQRGAPHRRLPHRCMTICRLKPGSAPRPPCRSVRPH